MTCGMVMPELDGVGFVRAQMSRRPLPIVIVSVARRVWRTRPVRAHAGAVDFIQKPTALATDRLLEISDDLIEKVTNAAAAHVHHVAVAATAEIVPRPGGLRGVRGAFDIVVIGISTGGPQALKLLVPRFPADLSVAVVVVLHMPVGYTQLYAEKLNEVSAVHVREAADDEPIEPGRVNLPLLAGT